MYTLPNWQDSPSTTTPLSSANLLEYNSAINDLDTRVTNSQPAMSVTTTNVSYSALANQIVLADTTSGSLTVAFPAAPANGTRVGVKQVTRGGTNTVTVQLSGSDVFNKTGGPTIGTITLLNQAGTWLYNSGVWVTISDDVPLSQLDTRYVGSVSNSDGSIAVTGTTSAPVVSVNQAGVSGLVNAYQQGGVWDYNVFGDLMSNMSRDDAISAYAFSSAVKTQLVLLGLAPAGSYSVVKVCVTTPQSASTITAALYSSSSLTSTSWTRLGSGNITPAISAAGVVTTSLPFTLSSPTYVLLQMALTSGTAYPQFAGATTMHATLANPSSGVPVSAYSASTTAPGSTLNPTSGFTNAAGKVWCALS